MYPTSSTSVSLCAVAILLLAICASAGSPPGQWFNGRVTRYGEPGDPWTIHHGACGYGYLDPNKATGWNVAAMADSASDFGSSCGRCYEVSCRNSVFKDNYGQTLDRSSVCYDQNASVVIQVTDACPCVYPANAYSNKRWCCGDMYHMDLSQWTFEKLAESKWGVIAVKFRWVPCDYQVGNPAKPISQPTPGYSAPKGWSSYMDKRPWV